MIAWWCVYAVWYVVYFRARCCGVGIIMIDGSVVELQIDESSVSQSLEVYR